MENTNQDEIKSLNHQLRSLARDKGLCDKWFKEWSDENYSLQQLIDKYIEGIDFCITNKYPSNEYIKTNFPQELLRKNGILVDDKWALLNPTYAVLLGKSLSTIRLNGRKVSQLYIQESSRAEIHIKDLAHVVIHLYDNAKIHIVCDNNMNKPLVVLHKGTRKRNISFEFKGNGADIQIKREV